jgi:hypothetical protein
LVVSFSQWVAAKEQAGSLAEGPFQMDVSVLAFLPFTRLPADS